MKIDMKKLLKNKFYYRQDFIYRRKILIQLF